MNTAAAMVGNEPQVLEYFGLHLTGNKHIDCGICGSEKSLRITIYNNNISYICKCSNGSIFEYLTQTTGKEFKDLASEIDKIIGRTYERQNENIAPIITNSEKALSKFKRLAGLKGTKAEIYLNNRGIYQLPKLGVKYNPKEGELQSLYSLATNDQHEPVYLHRTLLDGDKQAAVDAPKKLLSLSSGEGKSVAIRLFPMESTLGIAEGIESALSCAHIYRCSTWSTLNTSIMKKFRAPKGVKHLIIFADNDKKGAGHAAAFECAHRNMLADNDIGKVSVRWPSSVCDFNDLLLEGSEVYEWRFGDE